MKYLVKIESSKDDMGSIFVEIDANTGEEAVEEVKPTITYIATPMKKKI